MENTNEKSLPGQPEKEMLTDLTVLEWLEIQLFCHMIKEYPDLNKLPPERREVARALAVLPSLQRVNELQKAGKEVFVKRPEGI